MEALIVINSILVQMKAVNKNNELKLVLAFILLIWSKMLFFFYQLVTSAFSIWSVTHTWFTLTLLGSKWSLLAVATMGECLCEIGFHASSDVQCFDKNKSRWSKDSLTGEYNDKNHDNSNIQKTSCYRYFYS